MQIFRDLVDVRVNWPTVATIGTFDGIHRGHQDIIRQLKENAQTLQAHTAVIAFHPRPRAVFAPERFKNDYLTTAAERIALFEAFGVDVLALIPFTLELAQTSAFDFIKHISERLQIAQLCVGYDFALGKNRSGNIYRLRELGQEFNFSVCEISPFTLDGQPVSSTNIRECLQQGEMRTAARLLGRYPALTGEVVQGAQRGRTIGYPTANLSVPAERLLPANGVYATFVHLMGDAQRYASVTNVGMRPSFDEQEPTVEVHIFDFERNIYDQTVKLEFVERLRPEKKFDGVEQLVQQIDRDAARARQLLQEEIRG